MGVSHESVELGTGLFRAGHALVGVLAHDLLAAAPGVLAELSQLHFWILMAVGGAHPGVECHTGDVWRLLLRRSMCSDTFLLSHVAS